MSIDSRGCRRTTRSKPVEATVRPVRPIRLVKRKHEFGPEFVAMMAVKVAKFKASQAEQKLKADAKLTRRQREAAALELLNKYRRSA